MRRTLFAGLIALGALVLPTVVHAAPILTYVHDHHILTLDAGAPGWKRAQRTWYYRGKEAIPPARLRSCGTNDIDDPSWTYRDETAWNDDAIARAIAERIAGALDRPAGSVIIRESATGAITFEGRGLPGRTVDRARTVALTRYALAHGMTTIEIPLTESQPLMRVESARLRDLGIRDVVTVGESVFKGSPVNRRHNIAVGIAKFNGHLIPRDTVFSFVQILGPVNASTGYRKELVIQGNETLPDYGGGLCQVSSTAYRGPWEYGLPILQRKNHSYAVSYYSPQGTDATIYPPAVDMKFLNNTLGALLIQSFTDAQDRAFFIYYGTRDDRTAAVYGPFITNRVAAPLAERISYTTEIPAGERRKAGERHDGLRATWYRTVQMRGTGSTMERYVSSYEARPLTWQVGVASTSDLATEGDTSGAPSWLLSKP